MLKDVLDTNIFVSATIERVGASGRILQAWRQGKLNLISSPVLLAELEEVLKRPRIRKYQWLTSEEVAGLVSLMEKAAIQTSGNKLVSVVKEDPADDYVLSAAMEGSAEYIVTGNMHLLKLNPFQGIKIVDLSGLVKFRFRRSHLCLLSSLTRL